MHRAFYIITSSTKFVTKQNNKIVGCLLLFLWGWVMCNLSSYEGIQFFYKVIDAKCVLFAKKFNDLWIFWAFAMVKIWGAWDFFLASTMAKRIECLRIFMGFNEWLEEEEKDCSFFFGEIQWRPKEKKKSLYVFFCGIRPWPKLKGSCELLWVLTMVKRRGCRWFFMGINHD